MREENSVRSIKMEVKDKTMKKQTLKKVILCVSLVLAISSVTSHAAELTVTGDIDPPYPSGFYNKIITVDGDQNTYYPVVFPLGVPDGRVHDLYIFRRYSDPAPQWNPEEPHPGSLTLHGKVMSAGWGGFDPVLEVTRHKYKYAPQVAKVEYTDHEKQAAVWLRGGGAQYKIVGTLSSILDAQTNVHDDSNEPTLIRDYPNDAHDVYIEPVENIVLAETAPISAEVIMKLQALLKHVRVVEDEINQLKGPHVVLEAANVHIQSGSGYTDDNLSNGGALTGLGNLVVGYNEEPVNLQPGERGGSHNLIVNRQHRYSAIGGFIAGIYNTVSGHSGSVTGGAYNEVSGARSCVNGGEDNEASGTGACVSGGNENLASGDLSTVSVVGARSPVPKTTCRRLLML